MTENEKRLMLVQAISRSGSSLSPLSFVVVDDIVSEQPELSSDGGAYSFWRVIAKWNGKPVAVSYRTSCDAFDYCSLCGMFATHYPETSPCNTINAWDTEFTENSQAHPLADDKIRTEINRMAMGGWYLWSI